MWPQEREPGVVDSNAACHPFCTCARCSAGQQGCSPEAHPVRAKGEEWLLVSSAQWAARLQADHPEGGLGKTEVG